MAGETLKTAQELLASFPDNTGGLIEAVDSRNFVVSVTPAIGYVAGAEAGVPVSLPADQSWVDLMALLPSPSFVGNFWSKNANNAVFPDYQAYGVAVVEPTVRLVSVRFVVSLTRAGGPANSMQMQFYSPSNPSYDGLITDYPLTTTEETLIKVGEIPVDMAPQDTVSVRARSLGTLVNFTMEDVVFRVQANLI